MSLFGKFLIGKHSVLDEKAQKFMLLKNTEGKYFTFDEYNELVKANQTDKHKKQVYLYTTDATSQYTFVEAAKAKGYDVLEMAGQLDVHFVNKIESELKDITFKRVDAEVVDKLIEKDETRDSKLSSQQQDNIVPVFRSRLPENGYYVVMTEALDESALPVMITQSEFMRRMKDMSAMQGGMSMYGNLPESYNLVVNTNHPVIVNLAETLDKELSGELTKIDDSIEPVQKEFDDFSTKNASKKEDELSDDEKNKRKELQDKLEELRNEREEKLKEYGKQQDVVKQLIDIGLIANNMLKGEDLNKFVKRSVEFLGK